MVRKLSDIRWKEILQCGGNLMYVLMVEHLTLLGFNICTINFFRTVDNYVSMVHGFCVRSLGKIL